MDPKKLGDLEAVILLAVHELGPNAYGVTVKQRVEEFRRRHVAIGAIYTVLGRLEKSGLLTSHYCHPTPVRGGRAKRMISMTPLGSLALSKTLEEAQRFSQTAAELTFV